jgi:hypothetical protein
MDETLTWVHCRQRRVWPLVHLVVVIDDARASSNGRRPSALRPSRPLPTAARAVGGAAAAAPGQAVRGPIPVAPVGGVPRRRGRRGRCTPCLPVPTVAAAPVVAVGVVVAGWVVGFVPGLRREGVKVSGGSGGGGGVAGPS